MKSKNVKYWIWLSKALGFGSTKIKALYELYRDITVFCDGGEKEWQFSGLFTDTELRHLSNIKQDAADGIISRCDELGYSILPIDDDAYPKCLRRIPIPSATRSQSINSSLSAAALSALTARRTEAFSRQTELQSASAAAA